jgi:hypothetical protein
VRVRRGRGAVRRWKTSPRVGAAVCDPTGGREAGHTVSCTRKRRIAASTGAQGCRRRNSNERWLDEADGPSQTRPTSVRPSRRGGDPDDRIHGDPPHRATRTGARAPAAATAGAGPAGSPCPAAATGPAAPARSATAAQPLSSASHRARVRARPEGLQLITPWVPLLTWCPTPTFVSRRTPGLPGTRARASRH